MYVSIFLEICCFFLLNFAGLLREFTLVAVLIFSHFTVSSENLLSAIKMYNDNVAKKHVPKVNVRLVIRGFY